MLPLNVIFFLSHAQVLKKCDAYMLLNNKNVNKMQQNRTLDLMLAFGVAPYYNIIVENVLASFTKKLFCIL